MALRTTYRARTALLTLLCLFLFRPFLAAEELDLINRPMSISGYTGLISTVSPYTLPRGKTEVGVIALSEKSYIPNYMLKGYSALVSHGIAQDMELAVKGGYSALETQPNVRSGGSTDTEIAYKWNFRRQKEYSNSPGIALITSVLLPTSGKEPEINVVNHWGARAGLCFGSEIAWEDHTIGLFADGQGVVRDVSDRASRDSYMVFNAGATAPISKYRNLQIILEYNQVSGKKQSKRIYDQDNNGVTYGLRLVNERFNITVGNQFVHRSEPNYENASRIIWQISVKI